MAQRVWVRRLLPLVSLLSAGAGALFGQLIAPGQPVPRTTQSPVVFLNGYQNDCGSSTFAGTFGIADQVLRDNGRVSLFFNNCSVSGSPSIEKLGTAFGNFLAALRYTDGAPVDNVHVVAHSMGGLIVRSYLSGKQEKEGVFLPPAIVPIQKIVFLATPHFGTGVAQIGFGANTQLDEISSGSHFLYDLARWNDGTDDLRGVDALAAAGSGGTGQATLPGFDDGIVALTSASLGFVRPGRTRVLPYCHVESGGLVSLGGFCSGNAKGIARIRAASDDNARLLLSFLNGTAEWQSIGEAAEQNKFLSTLGGINVRPFTAMDAPLGLNSASATGLGGTSKQLNKANDEIAYTDAFPAGQIDLTAKVSAGNLLRNAALPAGTVQAYVVKPGPLVRRALPAAAALYPLSVAPRMILAIYGEALSLSTDQARTTALPTTLAGTQVLLNGTPLPLLYVSPVQINTVLPATATGLTQLTVQNADGKSSVNLFVQAAHPAIFTLDQNGNGAAAALNASNQSVVSGSNPLHAADDVELFLTGLGATSTQGPLQIATQTPVVTIGGVDCPVSYAGAAPGFIGLDQINCRVPAGIAASQAVPIVVRSGNLTSNIATVAVQ